MSDRVYNRAILDSCFISSLFRIDGQCLLLDHIDEYFAEKCVVDQSQFNEGPCNDAGHPCECLEDRITDEEAVEFYYENEPFLERIFSLERDIGDFQDVKMIAFAYKAGNCLLLSCDREVLSVSNRYDIHHLCFKAAVIRLIKLEPHIRDGNEFDLDPMFTEDEDPFFAFGIDRHCSECHPNGECTHHPSQNEHLLIRNST